MSNDPKIIILEGLPGAGKSTLANRFHEDAFIIPEIVLDISNEKGKQNEFFYLENDYEKLKRARENKGITFIERSYASTLAHNYARLILDGSKDYFFLLESFAKNKAKDKITPVTYLYLDIEVRTSLLRKKRPVLTDDLWTQEKYLNIIHDYYKNYFYLLEPDIPIITLDGEKELDVIYLEIKNLFIN